MNTKKTIRGVGMRNLGLSAFALALGVSTPFVQGAISYDESVSGDLSGSGLAPTSVSLVPGSNQVLGTTGRLASPDRDYLTFDIPPGMGLTSLKVLAAGGALGFIGIEIGPQLTVPITPPDATGLLGWHHYSAADINTDILDDLGVSVAGSTGFTPPLGPGTYSVWIQDTSSGTFDYGFDFNLAPVVPEASNGLLLGGALATLFVIRRRSAAGARSMSMRH